MGDDREKFCKTLCETPGKMQIHRAVDIQSASDD